MLRLRLTRTGKKAQPTFRVVLAEHSNAVKGKFIEVIGSYNPGTKQFTAKKDRIEYWVGKGAQPTDSLATLLKKEGFANMDQYIGPRNKKRRKKGAQPEEAAPAAAPAPQASEETAAEAAPEATEDDAEKNSGQE